MIITMIIIKGCANTTVIIAKVREVRENSTSIPYNALS